MSARKLGDFVRQDAYDAKIAELENAIAAAQSKADGAYNAAANASTAIGTLSNTYSGHFHYTNAVQSTGPTSYT